MTGRWSAVLFDFDYTLGDTERGIVASTRYALKQMGLSQPPEGEIRRTIGMTLERSFTALTGSADLRDRRSSAGSSMKRPRRSWWIRRCSIPAPGSCLTGWKPRGCAAGVVTNKNRPRIAAILERRGSSQPCW